MQCEEHDSATKRFLDLIVKFTGGMADSFSDCEDIKNTHEKMTVICQSGIGLNRLLTGWLNYIQTPVPDGVKYAKPVQRILVEKQQDPPVCTIYHSFKYNDYAVALSINNPISTFVDIKTKISDPSFDADSRAAALQYINALNDCVLDIHKIERPYCPTREEISEEIKRFRDEKEPASSPTRPGGLSSGFDAAIRSMEEGGVPKASIDELLKSGSDVAMQYWESAFNTMVDDKKTIYDVYTSGDITCLSYIPPENPVHDLNLATLMISGNTEYLQNCISQINVLVKVNANLPNQMRNRIEKAAETLAEKIVSGDASLNSLDLNQIGLDVLNGYDSNDLSSLAENISSLIPVISNIKGMPDGIGQNLSILRNMQ